MPKLLHNIHCCHPQQIRQIIALSKFESHTLTHSLFYSNASINKRQSNWLFSNVALFLFVPKNILGIFNVLVALAKYRVKNVKTSSSHDYEKKRKFNGVCWWLNLSWNKNLNDVEFWTCWTFKSYGFYSPLNRHTQHHAKEKEKE